LFEEMKAFALFALVALAALCAADNNPAMLEHTLAMQDADTNAFHTWVVLVAGSTSYSNYRHQASVCHAYQIAHKFGVPDDHIIVFMADDIAHSSENPFPGAVYNYFYIEDGHNVNVYKGVPKDYTRENATADNLVAVLTGMTPSSGSGKTLKPSKKDNVFFYYDDHGNTDIVGMPEGRYFTGEDITTVFQFLQKKKLYKNWVIFIQACYSGSLFYKQDIPDNVYIATSAPTDDSAYACWYDNTLGTFVTSCWPRGWIATMDYESPATVTFDQLYSDAWKFTQNSTEPCQYGDADVKKMTMKEFFGITKQSSDLLGQTRDRRLEEKSISVRQEDVPLTIARMRYERSGKEEDREALQNELMFRMKIDKIVSLATEAAVPDHMDIMRTDICTGECDVTCECFNECRKSGKASDDCKRTCCGYDHCYSTDDKTDDALDCTATLVKAFDHVCGKTKNDYLLSATKTFHRICRIPGANIQAAIEVFKQYC